MTQLQRLKEVSNSAIRNALQHERAEATGTLARLRDSLQSEKAQAIQGLQVRAEDAAEEVRRLRDELAELQSEAMQLRRENMSAAELRALAVERALQEQR